MAWDQSTNAISLAYSKGAFMGFSMYGAVLAVRDMVNGKFYKTRGISAKEILEAPRDEILKKADGKVHLLDDVYKKLEKFEDRYTEQALAELAIEKEQEKQADDIRKANAATAAQKAHDDFMAEHPEDHDIVEVNAKELASNKAGIK